MKIKSKIMKKSFVLLLALTVAATQMIALPKSYGQGMTDQKAQEISKQESDKKAGESSKADMDNKMKKEQEENKEKESDEDVMPQLNKIEFVDIKNHWAESLIKDVAAKGYFTGVSKTKFAPDLNMSRAQFITVLGRISHMPLILRYPGKIKDIEPDAYYTQYALWALDMGYMKGYDKETFKPNENISREQVCTILSKYLKNIKGEDKELGFKDTAMISPWAKEGVKHLYSLGIIQGKSGNKFDPKGTLTRAEMAKILTHLDRIKKEAIEKNMKEQQDKK